MLIVKDCRIGGFVRDEGPQGWQDEKELIDGRQLLDVGLEESFGVGVVEGFYVGIDIFSDVFDGEDEAVFIQHPAQ